MLELSHLDLELFDFAARFLIDLASASTIFQTRFAKLFESFDPAIYLLVANIVLYGRLAIIAAISNTFLDDLDTLFLGGGS